VHVEPVSRKVSKEIIYLTDIITAKFQELMAIQEEIRGEIREELKETIVIVYQD
jgi:phosphopantothenate synthetase